MRILRLIAFSISFICTSILVSANTEPSTLEEQINQQLTHSLYSLVIANAGLEIKTEYRPHALSRWIYLNSFLKEWDKRINEAKYSNSLEVFDSIAADKSHVLGRHYIYWKTLHDGASREHQTPLGKANNSFLGFILNSEKEKNLDQRLSKIIDGINRYLIVNSQEYKLSNILLEILKKSKSFEVSSYATQIQKQIPGYKNMETARLVGSLLLGGVSLKQLTGTQIPQLPKKIKGLRPEKIKKKAKSLYELGKSTLNSMSQHIALAKSIGLHTGILYFLASSDLEEIESINSSTVKTGIKDNLALVIQLKFIAKALTEKLFKSEAPDSILKEENTLFTNEEILNIIENTYQGVIREDEAPMMDLILSLEINSGYYPNELAEDIVINKIQMYQTEVHKLAADGILDEEDIEKIRILLIEGVISEYKRDYPNLVGIMLDWGGNCVAQTMLFTALLYPYQKELANANLELGIFLDEKHIETFIYNSFTNSYHEMVAGGLYTSTPQRTMYKPNFILALMARNFETDFNWPVNELRFHGPVAKIESPQAQVSSLWDKFKNIGKVFGSGGFSFDFNESMDDRFGILDTNRISDVDPRYSSTKTSSNDDIPYSANITYTRQKTPTNDGSSGAISEVDNSSNTNAYFIETDLENIMNEIISEKNAAADSRLEFSYEEPIERDQFKKFKIKEIDGTYKLTVFSQEEYFKLLSLQAQNDSLAIMERIVQTIYLEDDWAQSSLSYQNIFNIEKRSPIQLNWKEEDFLWLNTNIDKLEEKFSNKSDRNQTIFTLLKDLAQENPGDGQQIHLKYLISREKIKDRHTNDMNYLIESFVEDPSLFISLYQQLNKNGKHFLLSNFVAPLEVQTYYPFLGSGYLSKFVSTNSLLSSFRLSLSSYLENLSKASVIVKPPQEEVIGMCWSGPQINLPKGDLGWVFRSSDKDCDDSYTDRESQEKIELSAAGNSLAISADSLVELSLATGKGFQVWNEITNLTVKSGKFIVSSYLDARLSLDFLFEDILESHPDPRGARHLIEVLKEQAKGSLHNTSAISLENYDWSETNHYYKLRFNRRGILISAVPIVFQKNNSFRDEFLNADIPLKNFWCDTYQGQEKVICSMLNDSNIEIKLENNQLKALGENL